jgi:RecA-family ATPase
VPGFLAEGVNLLAGPPKVGKSWLSLDLALSVAAGVPALGSVEVEAGPVLCLALEATPHRFQSRMRKILDGRRAQPNARCPARLLRPIGLAVVWLQRRRPC